MACITISGYPCSGKTTRAAELKTLLENKFADPLYEGTKLKVEVVSDHSLKLDRSSYDDGRTEKPARSALFTALNRQLNQDTILIVDAMNYIKGFRYQIYCAAREAGIRTCTIFVAVTADLCRERNTASPTPYKSETFENLITRYEEPNSMVRWDAPLFTVPWNESLPGDEIFQAVVSGKKHATNQGTMQVAKPPADALQVLEQTTSAIVTQLMTLQSQSAGFGLGGSHKLSIPSATSSSSFSLTVELPPRSITLSELQRQKRQFITVHKKAVSQGLAGRAEIDWSEEVVAAKFAHHLHENLRP